MFRKKETLVSLIYLHMANTAVRAAPRPLRLPRSGRETSEILTDMMLGEGLFGGEYYLQSRAELALMAARDPQFSNMAWRMRMVGGLYEIRKDDPAFDLYGLFAFSVHARACWATGLALTRMAVCAPEARRTALLARLNANIDRFSLQ